METLTETHMETLTETHRALCMCSRNQGVRVGPTHVCTGPGPCVCVRATKVYVWAPHTNGCSLVPVHVRVGNYITT